MSIRNSRAPDENSGEACCLVDHSWVSPTHQLTSTNRNPDENSSVESKLSNLFLQVGSPFQGSL